MSHCPVVLLHPVQHAAQGAGFGHVEIVAGKQPYLAVADEEIEDERLDLVKSGVGHESDGQIEAGGVGHVRGHGIQQRVLGAAMDHPREGGWPRRRIADFGGLRQIVRLPRDDVPDATAWTGNIAAVARDDVHVEMRDGLAGRLTDIDADIVAGGLIPIVDQATRRLYSGEQRGSLGVRRVEPVGDVALGDGERVTFRDGKAVPDADDGLIFIENSPRWGTAEWAGQFSISLCILLVLPQMVILAFVGALNQPGILPLHPRAASAGASGTEALGHTREPRC